MEHSKKIALLSTFKMSFTEYLAETFKEPIFTNALFISILLALIVRDIANSKFVIESQKELEKFFKIDKKSQVIKFIFIGIVKALVYIISIWSATLFLFFVLYLLYLIDTYLLNDYFFFK